MHIICNTSLRAVMTFSTLREHASVSFLFVDLATENVTKRETN